MKKHIVVLIGILMLLTPSYVLADFMTEMDPELTYSENSYLFFANRGLNDRYVQIMSRELMKYIARVSNEMKKAKGRAEKKAAKLASETLPENATVGS